MIKDVEYAFFAQLSYLNWNNLDLDKLKKEISYQNKDFINFLIVLKIFFWGEVYEELRN